MTVERYSRSFENPLPSVSLGRLNRCERRVLSYCIFRRAHGSGNFHPERVVRPLPHFRFENREAKSGLQALAMLASDSASVFQSGECHTYVDQ
jgi:hypothetical protein